MSPQTGAGTALAGMRAWAWCLLLCLRAFAAHSQQPDLVLHGDLSGKDNQTWHLVPFDVPAGVARIRVDFDFTTREAHTAVDLGLLSPDGFRGWSGGNKRSFTISATDATPSYLPGPLTQGQWNLLLGVPNIRPNTRAGYTASIWYQRESGGPVVEPRLVLRGEQGWYRGDLHMHTGHSDGTCMSRRAQRVPCPLFLTAKTATERGLDFIAVTDHNTTSHADAIREIQPYFDDLLLLPGREITTFQGHANLFGSVAPLDFRVGSAAVPDWNTVLKNAAELGAIISINHPARPTGEQCMGCGWNPRGSVDYSLVEAVEVVNGVDADTPHSGIGFWETLLNQGYRLTAVGGSDSHDALRPAVRDSDSRQPNDGAIGVPTTVIYADELSQAGVIEGIRRGRVYIDLVGARGRMLDLVARAGERTAQMGATLETSRGTVVRFDGKVTGVPGGKIEVILDGKTAPLLEDSRIEATAGAFSFMWHADGQPHWIRLNVRDDQARLALLGNPIYLRPAN